MKKILSCCGLFVGASYPFRALSVFNNNPSLRGYLIVPILINIVLGITLYISLVFLGWQETQDLIVYLSQWIDNLIVNLPEWLKVLEFLAVGLGFLLRLIMIVLLLIITGFILAQFGVLLGAPWYGKLSEQLEKISTGKVENIEVGIIRDIWRAILFELKKLSLTIVVGFLLFLCNFLPGVGTLISTIGWITLTSTIVCLDFFDAPLERRRFPFRKKLGIIWATLPASAGFSLICLGLISIPLLNLVTIPLCVASGTLFFCDRILPKLTQ